VPAIAAKKDGCMRMHYVYTAAIAIIVALACFFMGVSLQQTWPSSELVNATARILEAIGIASFVFGLFSISIELKDWQKYFESRIKSIVVEQSYLRTLNPDTLRDLITNALRAGPLAPEVIKELMTSVLKVKTQNESLDQEGSFLRFFHDNLHRYIEDPYREQVSVEVIYKELANGGWLVLDRTTYVCRKSPSRIPTLKIQQEVVWTMPPEEAHSIRSVVVEVQYPYNHEKRGQREQLFPSEGQTEANNTSLNYIRVPIDDRFRDIDGLIVLITSELTYPVSRFQSWEMAHPTKNFDITITYPESCTIHLQPVVLNREVVLTTQERGYARIKYDSWMLPGSSLVWRIVPPSELPD